MYEAVVVSSNISVNQKRLMNTIMEELSAFVPSKRKEKSSSWINQAQNSNLNIEIMKMTIQTPDIKARPSLLDFVLNKVGKLEAFSEKILECSVYLKVEGSNELANKVSELKLTIPGQELFVTSQSKTFEESVMNAIEAVKPQLERWIRVMAP